MAIEIVEFSHSKWWFSSSLCKRLPGRVNVRPLGHGGVPQQCPAAARLPPLVGHGRSHQQGSACACALLAGVLGATHTEGCMAGVKWLAGPGWWFQNGGIQWISLILPSKCWFQNLFCVVFRCVLCVFFLTIPTGMLLETDGLLKHVEDLHLGWSQLITVIFMGWVETNSQ